MKRFKKLSDESQTPTYRVYRVKVYYPYGSPLTNAEVSFREELTLTGRWKIIFGIDDKVDHLEVEYIKKIYGKWPGFWEDIINWLRGKPPLDINYTWVKEWISETGIEVLRDPYIGDCNHD